MPLQASLRWRLVAVVILVLGVSGAYCPAPAELPQQAADAGPLQCIQVSLCQEAGDGGDVGDGGDGGFCDASILVCDASVSSPGDAGDAGDAAIFGRDSGLCTPETDDQLCQQQGVICGQIAVVDACGVERTPTCDLCPTGAACTSANVCACEPGFTVSGSDCAPGIGGQCPTPGTSFDCPTTAGTQQTCESYENLSICTFTCTTSTSCGTNGETPNVCLTSGTNQICVPGCDPIQSNPCANDQLVCALAGSSTTYVCLPNCQFEAAGWCSTQLYGGVCDTSTGACVTIACGSGGTCATGELCYTDQGLASPICVPNCNTVSIPCPSGTACKASGLCG